VVVARTERLVLRSPTLADVDALAAMWGDAETMRYVGDGSAWGREKVAERVERAMDTFGRCGMCFFVVERRGDGCVLGQCGVVPIEFAGPEVELGYRFGRAHWGRGYATEAARAAAEHAQRACGEGGLGVERLVAVTHPENAASRAVLTKVGFVRVGETDAYYGMRTVLFERRACARDER
jgi:RimJ/RimL family protein N-acetyltransferase